MSILAEPRRKQRLSVDPQNLNWASDEQKVSRKLMEKMGWNDGQGLGRNNQGNADNLKVKANKGSRGLGSDKLADYDSTWISHHDDFADLLKALNSNKKKADETEEEKEERVKKISVELSSKSLKRRIHYQKFTRAKDMTRYSEEDKVAVLGLRSKKSRNEGKEGIVKKEEENEKIEEAPQLESDFKEHEMHTVSKVSVGDYFAAKMAALKAKKEQQNSSPQEENTVKCGDYDDAAIGEESAEEDERQRKRKERKEQKRARKAEREKMHREEEQGNELDCQKPTEVVVLEEEESVAERKRRKKERKRLRQAEREREDTEVMVEVQEQELENKKKKKLK